jgi:hypothetical protein
MELEILLICAIFAPVAAGLGHPLPFLVLLVQLPCMLHLLRMAVGQLTRGMTFAILLCALWLGSALILWRFGLPRFLGC